MVEIPLTPDMAERKQQLIKEKTNLTKQILLIDYDLEMLDKEAFDKFVNEVKARMKEENLSQYRLAMKLGINPAALNFVFSHKKMNVNILRALTEYIAIAG